MPRSNIPDSHLAAIGLVANHMATLEFHIDVGIWNLVGAPQQLAACLTAQMISAHPRLRAFIALVEILGGSQATIDKLNKFQGQIGALTEKRNRMVHDPRMIKLATEETARLQITAKPKVHFGFLPEPEEEVMKVSNDLAFALRDFLALRDAAIAEIQALPAKSRPQLVEIIPAPDEPAPPSGA
jgi:hypothetical protein